MHMDKALRDFTVHLGHVKTTYLALISMPLKRGLAGFLVAFVAINRYQNGGPFDVSGFLLDLVWEEVWFDRFVFVDDLETLIGE